MVLAKISSILGAILFGMILILLISLPQKSIARASTEVKLSKSHSCLEKCTCTPTNSVMCSGLMAVPVPSNMLVLRLDILDSSIKTLQNDTFAQAGLQTLESLTMLRCQIQELELDALRGLRYLSFFNLGENNIVVLDLKVFEANVALTGIWLQLNSKLNELTGGAFPELPMLTHLSFRNCSLTSIQNATFRRLPSLKYLDLGGNELNDFDVNSLSANLALNKLLLSSNSNLTKLYKFPKLPRLTELYLRDCGLNQLQDATFSQLPALEYLNLGGNEFANLNMNIFQDNVELTELWLNSNLKLTTITNSAFPKLYKLTHLALWNCSLTSVQNIKISQFPSLEYLDLSGNELTEFNVSTLEGSSSLTQLWLNSNTRLTKLIGGPFPRLQNLTILALKNCGLTQLHRKLFSRLPSLDYLGLSENELVEIDLNIFDKNVALTELWIKKNSRLTKLTGGRFPSLPLLYYLSFRNCSLSQLQSNLFDKLESLKYLDLRENKFIEIDVSLFRNNVELIDLFLDSNPYLRKLTGGPFPLLPLTSLTINGCYLADLDINIFQNLPALLELDISENQFVTLNVNLFKNNTSLKKLWLKFNKKLTTITGGPFPPLPNLTFISLKGCNLSVIETSIFDRLLSLDNLDLSENNFAKMDMNIFGSNAALNQLLLQSNPNLNSLIEEPFSPLRNLEILSLRNCSLSFIDHHTFFGLQALKELILRENMIVSINLSIFTNNTALTLLSLGSNPSLTSLIGRFPPLANLNWVSFEACSLSQLQLDTFHDLYSLQHLDLSQNNFLEIDVDLFKMNRKLTQLFLNSNSLLSTVTGGPFPKLSQLSFIFLNGCNLSQLDIKLFSQLPSLEILNLSENIFSEIDVKLFSYNLKLEQLWLNSNSNLTRITGGQFPRLPKLQILSLKACNLFELEINTFYELNSLEGLDLMGNNFSEINVNVFNKCLALQKLYLNGNNNLSTLTGGSFPTLPNLNVLIIKQCNFHKFQTNIFQELVSLEILDLSENEFREIDVNLFKNNVQLTRLYLSHNFYLSELKGGRFPALLRLSELSLRKCRLYQLDINLFSQLVSLEILDLSENNFYEIDVNLFKYNVGLKQMGLNSNINLSVLSGDRFPALPRLSLLALQDCNLFELPRNIFSELSSLEILGLGRNKLLEVDVNVFKTNHKLRKLHFDVNLNLTKIIGGPFPTLPYLVFLSFMRCNLPDLRNDLFHELVALEDLNLSGNKFIEIDLDLFQANVALSNLSIDFNPHLKLEGKFAPLLRLTRVSICYSGLSQLHKSTFENLKNLEKLYLVGNHFKFLSSDIFRPLGSLTVLHLNNNQWRCDCKLKNLWEFYASKFGFNNSWPDVNCYFPITPLANLSWKSKKSEDLICPIVSAKVLTTKVITHLDIPLNFSCDANRGVKLIDCCWEHSTAAGLSKICASEDGQDIELTTASIRVQITEADGVEQCSFQTKLVALSDKGIWKCILTDDAENRLQYHGTVELLVLDCYNKLAADCCNQSADEIDFCLKNQPPKIIDDEVEVLFTEHQSNFLICRVRVSTAAYNSKIEWQRNGTILPLERQVLRKGKTEDALTLSFKNVSIQDAGNYTCLVTNPLNTTKQTFVVSVIRADTENDLTTVISITSILVGLCILGAVAYIKYWKINLNGVPKEEIRLFKRGNSNFKGKAGTLDNIENMPYNEVFEIHSSRFTYDTAVILGKGNFGIVFKGSFAERAVAIKTCLTTVSKSGAANANASMYIRSLLSEIKVMCYLSTALPDTNKQHSGKLNIVCLIGSNTKNIRQGTVFLISEFCELGSLEAYLRKHRKQFHAIVTSGDTSLHETQEGCISTIDLTRWAYEIANGMSYVSSRSIIHADLASRNVLLTNTRVAKIADFGLSRRLYELSIYKKQNQEPLPWKWMSVEALKDYTLSTQSDIWSYGITLWEIFSLAEVPYPCCNFGDDFVRRLEQGLRPSCPKYASAAVYNLMQQTWLINPAERRNFENLCLDFRTIYAEYTDQTYVSFIPMTITDANSDKEE